MNNIDISNFIIQAKALVKNFDVGLCITILNASGNKEFFISLGEIRPCSIDMSEKRLKLHITLWEITIRYMTS